MNREIKFRAWDGKKMSRPFGFGDLEGYEGESNTVSSDDVTLAMNKEFTGVELMQFTGLLDKNGKEIYEGDILKEGALGYLVEVKFLNGHFGWDQVVISEAAPPILPYFDFKDTEVIGNIYENPELTKPR